VRIRKKGEKMEEILNLIQYVLYAEEYNRDMESYQWLEQLYADYKGWGINDKDLLICSFEFNLKRGDNELI
jgi:hypothetical protein